MLSKYPNVRWSLCAGECYLETNDFIQFSTRKEAQTDHLFMNKPALDSAPMRTPLSTPDYSIILSLLTIYSKTGNIPCNQNTHKSIWVRDTRPDNIAA